MPKEERRMFRVGTCAFSDHEGLYPRGLPRNERLRYYAQQFNLVEVDATFYRALPRSTAVRWVEQVPRSFRFDIKAPGSLTGHRPFDPGELTLFLDFVTVLQDAGRLGAVLVQWAPWVKHDPTTRDVVGRLRTTLHAFPVAIEFRHRSWYRDPEALAAWLQELDAVHVVVDAPVAGQTTVPWYPRATHPALAYVRFHGRNAITWNQRGLASSQERFNYRYSDEELQGRLPDLLDLHATTGEVHILMNNNYGSYAVDGARWFRDRLCPLPGTQLGFSLD
jgi:uncharacterized protein YecE (DUF72 family)